MQSLPAMNGVPEVSNFSFTLFQSPGEKQANIRITSREVRIVVYHETDIPRKCLPLCVFKKCLYM